ncbi:MAG: hypothetical protein KDD44_12145, partial [Bdellovibrionales bacterium]|nr:hypothetical protein [Bdellovibrionales bacterium]
AELLPVRFAIWTAPLLLTTYGFHRMGADGRVDMVFTGFFVAALCLVIRECWREQAYPSSFGDRLSSWPWWCVGLLVGLAVLAKGPLGVGLAGLLAATLCIVHFGMRGLRLLLHPGWLLAVMVPLPWYFQAAEQGGSQFLSRQLLFENIKRFVGGEGITAKGPLYYLGHLWSQSAPWLALLLVGACLLLFRNRSALKAIWLEASSAERFLARSAVAWLIVGLVFFSLAEGKRRSYLLPLLPALTIAEIALVSAAARYYAPSLVALWRKASFRHRLICWMRRVTLGVAGLLIIGVLGVWAVPLRFEPTSDVGATVVGWRHTVSGTGVVRLAVPLAIAGIVLALLQRARKSADARLPLTAGWLIVEIVFLGILTPGLVAKGHSHTYRRFAEDLRRDLATDANLHFVKERLDESFDGFFFYWHQHVTMVPPTERPTTQGFYLARRSWFDEQPEGWQSAATIRIHGGRLVDRPDEELLLFSL